MLWGGSATAIGPQSGVDVGTGLGVSAGLGVGIAVGDADPGLALVDVGNDSAGAAGNEHPTSRQTNGVSVRTTGAIPRCTGATLSHYVIPRASPADTPSGV